MDIQVGDLENVNITHWANNAKSTGGWSIMITLRDKELIKEIKERISSLTCETILSAVYEIAPIAGSRTR